MANSKTRKAAQAAGQKKVDTFCKKLAEKGLAFGKKLKLEFTKTKKKQSAFLAKRAKECSDEYEFKGGKMAPSCKGYIKTAVAMTKKVYKGLGLKPKKTSEIKAMAVKKCKKLYPVF